MNLTTVYNIGDIIEFPYRARHQNQIYMTAPVTSIAIQILDAEHIHIRYFVCVNMQTCSINENEIISRR